MQTARNMPNDFAAFLAERGVKSCRDIQVFASASGWPIVAEATDKAREAFKGSAYKLEVGHTPTNRILVICDQSVKDAGQFLGFAVELSK